MVEGQVLLRFGRVLLRVGTVLLLAYALICLALWRYQPRLMFFPAAELRGSPADLGLAYEEVWLPAGDGKVHGWWMPAAPALPSRQYYCHSHASTALREQQYPLQASTSHVPCHHPQAATP
ncbi:MAG: hypothetical protein AAFO83_03240, partial [Cyanobacteria bacterium J06607_13]